MAAEAAQPSVTFLIETYLDVRTPEANCFPLPAGRKVTARHHTYYQSYFDPITMAFAHPRRSQKTTLSPMTLQSGNYSIDESLTSPQSLRKGATFHIPSTPASDLPCRLVRRAESSLEDIVEAHKRRVALALDDIEASLSAMNLGDARPTPQSFRDDSLPVPQGFLNHTVDKRYRAPNLAMSPISSDATDLTISRHSLRPRRQNRRQSPPSDSGLGSSIASSSAKKMSSSQHYVAGGRVDVSASAITRSLAPSQSSLTKARRLSKRAYDKVRQLILQPLLAQESLKAFHPLVADCPRRIKQNEIVCLRDLEKTLLLMAPVSDHHKDSLAVKAFTHWFSSELQERSETAKAYLEFCSRSIYCIQATVDHLNDRELTRPNDRPYSSGYFIDLVEQLRNHATALEASKEKQRNGESLDDMDVDGYVSFHPNDTPHPTALLYPTTTSSQKSIHCRLRMAAGKGHQPSVIVFSKSADANEPPIRSEQVTLYGGLHKNGRPSELVRIGKDGTAISLATGKEVPRESIESDEKGEMRFKRSLSMEEDEDESIARSMARRKASATAAELAPKRCNHAGCEKEFKRACDLTKHEKTHSRPWKCSDINCRYHEYGWPTEKELERHRNDKHSANPKLFNCLFKPCAYSSKRESNCKQHMEKSHNWKYVRSKNNGKNRDQQGRGSLPTPQETHLQTPVTEHEATPEDMRFDGSEASVTFNGEIYNENHVSYPAVDSQYHGELTLEQFHISPADSNMQYSSASTSPFQDNSSDFPVDNIAANFGNQNDFTLYEDLYNASAAIPSVPFTMMPQYNQLPPTPEKSLFGRSYDSSAQFPNLGHMANTQAEPQHLSPIGQGNAMLFTPASMMGDSFDYLPSHPSDGGFDGDFALFSNNDTFLPAAKDNNLFGEMPSSGTGLSQFAAAGDWKDFYATQTTQLQTEWLGDDVDMMGM